MTGQEQQQAAAERLIAVDRSSWQRHRRLQLGAVCLPHQVATGAMSNEIATKILEQSIEANNGGPILATTSPRESFKLC
jgi:hypothetical protein